MFGCQNTVELKNHEVSLFNISKSRNSNHDYIKQKPDDKNQGQRNEPAYLINTLDTIAALRDLSPSHIAEQTTNNAETLFSIGQHSIG